MVKEKTKTEYTFKSQDEREVATCIAIQKTGMASIDEIIDFIKKRNGKITEKQVEKCVENLRRKQLISIDLKEKKDGVSLPRFAMRSIKFTVPENGQIKDLVDDPSVNPLKEEMDRSKKTMKKGVLINDYYKIEIKTLTEGEVQGFVPLPQFKDETLRFYRKGQEPVIHPFHINKFLNKNISVINLGTTAMLQIKVPRVRLNMNGGKIEIGESYVTNPEGSNSGRGGGRGTRKYEVLPEGTEIIIEMNIPETLIKKQDVKKIIPLVFNEGGTFGGNHKQSSGRLNCVSVDVVTPNMVKD